MASNRPLTRFLQVLWFIAGPLQASKRNIYFIEKLRPTVLSYLTKTLDLTRRA